MNPEPLPRCSPETQGFLPPRRRGLPLHTGLQSLLSHPRTRKRMRGVGNTHQALSLYPQQGLAMTMPKRPDPQPHDYLKDSDGEISTNQQRSIANSSIAHEV